MSPTSLYACVHLVYQGALLCSGEVGKGGGWQGKVSSPLLQCGPGQPNSPTHPEESTVVWHERGLKCWQRVLGAPAGPGSQSLDCWIFQEGLGHGAPLGKYQPMWRRNHRSSLFLDSVFASLPTHYNLFVILRRSILVAISRSCVDIHRTVKKLRLNTAILCLLISALML